MNRAETTDPRTLTDDRLPPRTPGGPARVLFLTSTALGFSTYDKELRRFTAQRQDLDAVHVSLTPPAWMRLLGKRAAFMRNWDFQSARYLTMWRRVISEWLRESGPLPPSRFDIIHVTTELNARALPEVSRRTSIPFSVHIDTTTRLFCDQFGYSRTIGAFNDRSERAIFPAAAMVSCMSQWAADSVVRDYHVPRERVTLVRSTIELPAIPPAAFARRGESGKVRLIIVGNDWPRKGGPRLLAWHQKHFAERAELHVVSGRVTPDPSARNVVWHGSVPRERLLTELLPSMDAFILPTREDMTPWAVIEAMACRLPVVTSRLAGLPELVVHGQTGLLADRNDDAAFIAAIDRVISDAPLRERMAGAARTRFETEFDPARWYGVLLDRLRDLGLSSRAARYPS